MASLIVFLLTIACGAARPAGDPPLSETAAGNARALLATPPPRERAIVTLLIDGDTLVLHVDGRAQPVRLLLIDAPEADLGQCFSAAASAFVAAVAPPGSTLEIEQDVSDADPFGRLLRYVYLADGSMLNEQLVRGGFARVTPEPPDDKYLERLREAEDAAREDGVGLWGACGPTPTPAPILQASTPSPTATPLAASVVAAAAAGTPAPTSAPTPQPTAEPTGEPTVEATSTPAPTSTPTPAPLATATATPTATAAPTPEPTPEATQTPPPTATADPRAGCDPSYPTVCIPPPPPDLDCGDITYRRFTVLQPDPHRFDGDKDGIGCES